MSDQVERFKRGNGGGIAPSSDGEWVRFSDLVDIEAEWAKLLLEAKAERDQAVKQRDEELRELIVSRKALGAAFDAMKAQGGSNLKAPILAAFDAIGDASHQCIERYDNILAALGDPS